MLVLVGFPVAISPEVTFTNSMSHDEAVPFSLQPNSAVVDVILFTDNALGIIHLLTTKLSKAKLDVGADVVIVKEVTSVQFRFATAEPEVRGITLVVLEPPVGVNV